MSSFKTTCYEHIHISEEFGMHPFVSDNEPVSQEELEHLNDLLKQEDATMTELLHLGQTISFDPTLKDQELLVNLLFYIERFPRMISWIIRPYAARFKPDELIELLMDQMICFDWTDDDALWKTCLLAVETFEMAGTALEKMTREKDWMLFLPFLTNQAKKTLDKMEDIILEKANDKEWNKLIVSMTNCFLDLVDFLNTTTIKESPAEYPLFTMDIGFDNGDVKRRYLGYYILNTIYDKVIANLDLKLSDKFYKRFHPEYTVSNPNKKETKTSEQEIMLFELLHRTIKISALCGCTFDRMYHIYTSLNEYMRNLPEDEAVWINDRQMINSRLYPLCPTGITTLLSVSLYAAVVGSGPSEFCLLPTVLDSVWIAKKVGALFIDHLTTPSSSRLDKALFIMLYFADDMSDTTMTMDHMDIELFGYTGSGISVQVSRFLEIIATMASNCPDSNIRFYSYQLVQSLLKMAEDQVRVFILTELLDRCPYPSMHTAAIGLLKDQLHRSFDEYGETKEVSIFTSPLVIEKFFSIIFKFKSDWEEDKTFWEDYNYIMQALNLYYYILIRDKSSNLTTVWSTKDRITKDYINPVKNKLEALMKTEKIPLNCMQLEMMLEVVDKINQL